jgi:putative DNA primase/helicase
MILEGLLRQIKPVDFYAIANTKGDKEFKLKNRDVIVIAIDEILRLAENKLCLNNGKTYVYNGCYWSEVEENMLKSFLGEAAARQGIDKLASKHFNYREHLLKQFESAAYLPEPEEDPDKVLINLQNGTLEISASEQTIKLREFKASDFLKYQLTFIYDSSAKAPLFVDYLQHVLPDAESRKALLEYLGYLFIKHSSKRLKLEKVLILLGTGENGKSVLYEVMESLLGKENLSHYSLAKLTDNAGNARAKFADKILNYATEINGAIGSDYFKAMASGEPVSARLLYKDEITLTQYPKMIFNCNELPKEVENTNGFFRRFMIIPFEVTIPKEEQDNQLSNKIVKSELSGVLNLIIHNLQDLLQRGQFPKCDAIEKAREEYQLESDSVRMFLHETMYQPSKRCTLLLKKLFTDYTEYCRESGNKPLAKPRFSKRLQSLGYSKGQDRYGVFYFVEEKTSKVFTTGSPPSPPSHSEADREESEEREAILQSFEFFEEI